MATGPGRPVRSRSKAPAIVDGMSRALVICSASRVTERKHSIWLTTSWSEPASRPTIDDWMSDMITATGIEPA
jgi:hypothetical protein